MMPKIKILLAITKGNWGGAQRYVYDLATNLPPERFAVSVAAGQGEELKKKLAAQNIPVFNLGALGRDIKLWSDGRTLWQLYRLLRQEQPDVLHLNSPKMGLLGGLAGRLVGIKKIVYTSHGWPYQEDRPHFAKLFLRALCWLITRLAHQTIVISRSELTNPRFKLIYNGLGPINFRLRDEARAQLGLNKEDLVVGTIAELHKNKGLEYLPETAGAQIVIIGEGEERKKLENKNLKLAGHLNDAARLLGAFDIFVLPSIKEGLPYVILEAGLAGLPVVASAVGGIPEIVTDGLSGFLVEPKSSAALAQALQKLLTNPERRTQLGQELKTRVQTQFGLERMVRETAAVYLS
jgi:glycosyltransferase involved in cell wall biosynthesis